LLFGSWENSVIFFYFGNFFFLLIKINDFGSQGGYSICFESGRLGVRSLEEILRMDWSASYLII